MARFLGRRLPARSQSGESDGSDARHDASGRRFSRRSAVFVGYLALAALFYAPLLLGLRIFPPGDFTEHFLPFSLFQRAELLAGRLPLWNPYTFAGHPFLADVQAAVFYPLSNLFLLLTLPWSDPAGRLYWLQVEAVCHIALAGFFTYLLAQRLVRQRVAAFLAGAVFAFSGYLTGYPPLQLAVLRTAIWLPLILWLLQRAFEQPARWRWWAAAAAAYASAFLAGHPQTFLYISYAVGAWLLLLLAAGRAGPAGSASPWSAGRYAVRIALFYGLALGLSAAQWLPGLEFMRLSVRASTDYAFVSGGFPLRDTGQFLLPAVFSAFSPLYVGLAPLGLAGLGIVLATRKPRGAEVSEAGDAWPGRGPVLFFAALALVALLLSYGGNAFLYPLFYRWAPGWNLFRDQERAAYLVAFSLSVLAGYGAAGLKALSPQGGRLFGLGYAGLAAVGVIGVAAIARAMGAGGAALGGKAGLGLAMLAAWALIWLRLRAPRKRQIALLALALADLFIAGFTLNLSPPRPIPAPAAVAVGAGVAAAAPADGSAPPRVHNDGVLPENYGMLVGVEEVGGSSPLRLARYAALLGDFPRDRLWQLTGVRYVLSAGCELYAASRVLVEISGPNGPACLHELATPNPRAWAATTIATADDAAALPLLGDAGFDPRTTALLPPAPNGVGRPLGLEDGSVGAGESAVRLERGGPDRLIAHVRSAGGGLLVVSENWLPGWRATVRRDSAPAVAVPVVRADLTLLAAPIAAGESTVELVYRPVSVTIGLLITAFSVLLLALAVLWHRGCFGLRRRVAACRAEFARGERKAARERRSPKGIHVILLVAFAARVFRLGYQELRGDEALGRLFSLEPFGQIVQSTLALREPHPVASYFLQKVWFAVAGHSEFALRFVSLWFSVLAVALLYRLGRRLRLGHGAAALAAGLMALSPYAIWHSQDARMYSMSLALTTASVLLMCEALARRRWPAWAGYVGVTLLALHTHYYAAYVIAAQNLFVLGRALWTPAARREVRPWLAAQIATGLLYLPWLIAARAALTGYVGNGDSPGFVAMWMRALSVFAAGESVPAGQRPLLAGLAAALVVIGLVRMALAGPAGRRSAWLLGFYLFTPLLATWLGALSRPIFNERYLVAALPGFYLLVAAAVGPAPAPEQPRSRGAGRRLALRALPAVFLAGLTALSLLALARHYDDPAYSKTRGWRTLAAVLERHAAGYDAERVRVAQTYPDPTLWYYYTGSAPHLVLPPAAHDAAGADAEAARLAGQGVERVVMAAQTTAAWDASGAAAAALAKQYELIGETPVAGWRVQVYERPPAELTPFEASFAGGLRLTAMSVPARRLAAGDMMRVYLRWEGPPAALRGSEKLTLQLLDAQGRLAAQTDRPFGAAELAAPLTAYTLALPRFLPPGAYRLILALYDPGQPAAPRLLTAAGADHVELARLTAADMPLPPARTASRAP